MHTCPDCGQACSCSGDVEDHDTGDEFYDDCTHFMRCSHEIDQRIEDDFSQDAGPASEDAP